MAPKNAGERMVVTVRVDPDLVRKLDRRATAARKDRGAKWSRNDEIERILEEAVRA
jgi:predicted transcriptional regulator